MRLSYSHLKRNELKALIGEHYCKELWLAEMLLKKEYLRTNLVDENYYLIVLICPKLIVYISYSLFFSFLINSGIVSQLIILNPLS